MISTVASKDMSRTVATKEITMFHSVFDMLGVTSLSSVLLKEAAAAVSAMARVYGEGKLKQTRPKIALTLFGFITEAAVNIKALLEERGFEVIPFHANGTAGLAMEELAREGYFTGVLDLAPHELVDRLLNGYLKLIGPGRLENNLKNPTPRLVVLGGLECAVLEFERLSVPEEYRDRQIFFYDFRSAIRFNRKETITLARILAKKLNTFGDRARVIVSLKGWSEADGEGRALYNPLLSKLFLDVLKEQLQGPEILYSAAHINEKRFAIDAVNYLVQMLLLKKG